MNLVVDIGNSFTKVAVFDGTELVHLDKSDHEDGDILERTLSGCPQLVRGIVASVGVEIDPVLERLSKNRMEVVVLDENTPIPIENLYQTKTTLGKDRLAAAVGAWMTFPDHDILIVDVGTALTFDFVNRRGQYLGGSISPGLQMRFRALHHFAKRLPLAQPDAHYTWPANNTMASIVSGVQTGMIMEINGMLEQQTRMHPGLQTILTGGDALFFDKILKNSIFVDLNLVLKGLNRILAYHVEIR